MELYKTEVVAVRDAEGRQAAGTYKAKRTKNTIVKPGQFITKRHMRSLAYNGIVAVKVMK